MLAFNECISLKIVDGWVLIGFFLLMRMQTLARMFIINAGPGFKMLWGTIKGFLDSDTATKIHVPVQPYTLRFLYCLGTVVLCNSACSHTLSFL